MSAHSEIFVGVAASAGAALLLSTGTIIQALDARLVERHHGLRLSLLGRLLRRRRWVVGTIIGYLAFPFQLVALDHASLVIVQPVHACGLLLLLGAGALMFDERVRMRELGGVVAIVAGLAMVTWGAPVGRDPPVSEAALAGTTAALALLAMTPYVLGVRCGKRILIVSAALGFASTNLAVKGFSFGLSHSHLLLAGVYLALAAVGSVVGVLTQMTAFQRYRAVDIVPLTFSIPTFLPALLGLVVLREQWASAALGGAPFAIGAALLLAGTGAVTRSAAVTSVSKHATEEEGPHAPPPPLA